MSVLIIVDQYAQPGGETILWLQVFSVPNATIRLRMFRDSD